MAKQTFTSGQTLTAAQMTTLQANDFNWSVSTQTANYTLQAADKGTREVMNMSSAGTVTVPNATFDAGDIVWVHSIGSGTITLAAGTGMTLNSSAGTAPTLAQWEGGVVYFTSASSSIFFRGGGTGYGVATGGSSSSITVSGVNYTLLTFTSTGTLTVTKAGLFDYTFVGPGGAGGTNGRGGGAGGCISQGTVYLSANETITIGAGVAGSTNATRNTERGTSTTNIDSEVIAPAGAFGDGSGGIGAFGGGSGGNHSSVGSTAGANGSDISAWLGQAATTTYKAGGGGGGADSGVGGAGGLGGGGNGQGTGAATAGAVNSGGGGGGAKSGGTAGANNSGGSGIAYIRFKV